MSFLSPSKLETRSIFLERGGQYAHSDEEDGYESPDVKRRGASVDDFLKGSELGKPVSARWGARRQLLAITASSRASGGARPLAQEEDPGELPGHTTTSRVPVLL